MWLITLPHISTKVDRNWNLTRGEQGQYCILMCEPLRLLSGWNLLSFKAAKIASICFQSSHSCCCFGCYCRCCCSPDNVASISVEERSHPAKRILSPSDLQSPRVQLGQLFHRRLNTHLTFHHNTGHLFNGFFCLVVLKLCSVFSFYSHWVCIQAVL